MKISSDFFMKFIVTSKNSACLLYFRLLKEIIINKIYIEISIFKVAKQHRALPLVILTSVASR